MAGVFFYGVNLVGLLASAVVSTSGLDRLIGAKGQLQDVLRKSARNVERGGKERSPVDTGANRASIQVFEDNIRNLEVVVGPTTEYAAFLEFGTVRMAARPYMTPALEAERPKFLSAIKEVLHG
jgi:HK97 gp10 family phage protein